MSYSVVDGLAKYFYKFSLLQCSCVSLTLVCVRSLQRRFPIDNVLLLSGDIRDQVAKLCEIAPKFDVFGPPNLVGGKKPPKFLTEFYKCGIRLGKKNRPTKERKI